MNDGINNDNVLVGRPLSLFVEEHKERLLEKVESNKASAGDVSQQYPFITALCQELESLLPDMLSVGLGFYWDVDNKDTKQKYVITFSRFNLGEEMAWLMGYLKNVVGDPIVDELLSHIDESRKQYYETEGVPAEETVVDGKVVA